MGNANSNLNYINSIKTSSENGNGNGNEEFSNNPQLEQQIHQYMLGLNDNNNQKNIITSNSITIPSDRSPLDIKSSVSQYRIEKPSGLQKKRNTPLDVMGLGN